MSPSLIGSNLGSFINERVSSQVFVPSKNTLDAAAVFVKMPIPGTATITASVANMTAANVAGIIASKTITASLAEEKWILFDFEDVPMPQGIYALKLTVSNPDSAVDWLAVDNNCYESGYAVVGSGPRMTHDFGFAIYSYDSQPIEPEPNNPDSDPDPQPQPDPKPQRESRPSNTQSSNSNSTNVSDETSASNSPNSSSETNTDTASNSTPNQAQEKPKSPPGNTANINAKTTLGEKLMSDEELQEQIALAVADYNEHKTEGIFGLGGVLGQILTWTNIAILFGAIAIIIIVSCVIRYFTRRKNTSIAKR